MFLIAALPPLRHQLGQSQVLVSPRPGIRMMSLEPDVPETPREMRIMPPKSRIMSPESAALSRAADYAKASPPYALDY